MRPLDSVTVNFAPPDVGLWSFTTALSWFSIAYVEPTRSSCAAMMLSLVKERAKPATIVRVANDEAEIIPDLPLHYHDRADLYLSSESRGFGRGLAPSWMRWEAREYPPKSGL